MTEFGYTDQVLAHNYYPGNLVRNGKKLPLKNKPVYLPEKFDGLGSYTPDPKEYSHDYLMKETLNFIAENADKPFFLYLPFTIPHENGEQLKGMKFEVPDQGIYADKSWTKEQKDYPAMISYLDAGIGDIVRATRSAGIEDKTLILFCSDNGPMRKHPVTEFFNSNGDLRGRKRDLYEGGIRSPLLAYWPTTLIADCDSPKCIVLVGWHERIHTIAVQNRSSIRTGWDQPRLGAVAQGGPARAGCVSLANRRPCPIRSTASRRAVG